MNKKAVAVKYSPDIEVPLIMAKGEGKKAEQILQIAEDNNILIKEDKILVDLLGVSQVGDIIPENTWEAMAKIFSFILDYKK